MRALDTVDRAIIRALQRDARLSNKELAARIGLSPSSTHERVQRLHHEKVLGAAHMVISPEALGIALEALIMTRLKNTTSENIEAFRSFVLELQEVVAVYHVTGATDYILKVAVRNADHLRQTIVALSSRVKTERVETFVVLFKESRPLPDLLEPPLAV